MPFELLPIAERIYSAPNPEVEYPHNSIVNISIHPIKSMGATPLNEALLLDRGLAVLSETGNLVMDRGMQLISMNEGSRGKFITQRDPFANKMAVLQPIIEPNGQIVLYDRNSGEYVPLRFTDELVQSKIDWDDDPVQADLAAPEVNAWISDRLMYYSRKPVNVGLVRMNPKHQRKRTSSDYGGEYPVTFADSAPLHIINMCTLNELNRKLVEMGELPLPLATFRANLTVNLEPFEEYSVDHITTPDGVTIRFIKPCERCPIPVVNQPTGERTNARVLRAITELNAESMPKQAKPLFFGVKARALVSEGTSASIQVGYTFEVTHKIISPA